MESVRRNSLFLSVTWAILILVLCAMPGRYLPSAGWLELLSADKLVHAAMFCVLGVLLIMACVRRRLTRSLVVIFLLLAVVYGLLLELGQSWIFSGRSMEMLDFVANATGVSIAAAFYKRLAGADAGNVSSGGSPA